MTKLYGQKEILSEINLIVKDILSGVNHNVILRAPSGYGKTTLALNILYVLGWEKNGEYHIPEKGVISLTPEKKYYVIDEVHTLENPEFLYPLMDSGTKSFILCTNESGILKEPLRNRCIQFIFKAYSDDEILEITSFILGSWKLPDEFLLTISKRTKNNPRYAQKLCERLAYVFTWKGVPKTLVELNNILEKTLLVQSNGLNQNDLTYIEFLSRVGRSSLNNIISATGLDKDTVQSEIEPYLLLKDIIRISSRGREYVRS